MTTYYTKDHEYLRLDGDVCTIGITDYAQKALGDVVYVELPKTGATLAQGAAAGVVESVKSASEVYAPVSGDVVETNADLAADPALVNQDPTGKAWFFKLRLSKTDELNGLMDEAAYHDYTKGL